MTVLPNGWVSKRLGDLAQVTMGQSPPGSSYNRNGQGIPFFQGKAEFGAKHPTVRQWTTAATKYAEPGDILMSVRAPVGPTNIADTHCAIGRGLAGIRAGSNLNQSYLIWYLKHVEASIQARGKGTTFDAISGNDLRDTVVNLPPLEEQHRIVKTLDNHLSRLKKALAELEKSSRLNNNFKESLIHGIVSGHYSDHSSDWQVTTLGRVAKWSSGGTPQSGNPNYYGGQIPWCVIGDLTESQVAETAKTITDQGLAASSAKIVNPGTVLLAMYGASIGRTGMAEIPMATNQAIACAVPNANLDPNYLLLYLQSQKRMFIESGKGGAQPNISQTIIKEWALNLPPLEEQKRLLRLAESHQATIKSLNELTMRLENQYLTLRRSLLNAAFTGGLVA